MKSKHFSEKCQKGFAARINGIFGEHGRIKTTVDKASELK